MNVRRPTGLTRWTILMDYLDLSLCSSCLGDRADLPSHSVAELLLDQLLAQFPQLLGRVGVRRVVGKAGVNAGPQDRRAVVLWNGSLLAPLRRTVLYICLPLRVGSYAAMM